jgi:hypothetical protein
VGLSGLALLVMRTSKRRLPYPPGLKSFPVVGNLFSMPSQDEWVTFRKWSEELGVKHVHSRRLHLVPANWHLSGSDIIHADIMGSHIIILNSMKVANELLEKRSSIYSDR